MNKSTPRPWKCKKGTHYLHVYFKGESIGMLGMDESYDDHFILKAVNCHDELIDALKELKRIFLQGDYTEKKVLNIIKNALIKVKNVY